MDQLEATVFPFHPNKICFASQLYSSATALRDLRNSNRLALNTPHLYQYDSRMGNCTLSDGKETRQSMYVSRNTETRSRNNGCRGKVISITDLCVCVCVFARLGERLLVCACVCGCVGTRARACACARVASLIQYAKRSHTDKVTERKVCVLVSSTILFEIFLILRRI